MLTGDPVDDAAETLKKSEQLINSLAHIIGKLRRQADYSEYTKDDFNLIKECELYEARKD